MFLTCAPNFSYPEHDDDLTLTNVSTIPEDKLEADTYYSQFDDEFEDDEDHGDSGGSEGTDEEDEHHALINQLQAALELDTQETLVEDDTVERFSPRLRQQRIFALKQYPLVMLCDIVLLDNFFLESIKLWMDSL